MYNRPHDRQHSGQSRPVFCTGVGDHSERPVPETTRARGRTTMSKAFRLTRRTVLKGLGTAVALPLLDRMDGGISLAADGAARPAPLRMAFLYVPNGMHMQDWTPTAEGADF